MRIFLFTSIFRAAVANAKNRSVALQRENNRLTHNGLVPERPSSLWHEYAYEPQPSQPLSALANNPPPSSPTGEEKKKKKKGLAKLWGRFTGSSSAKSPPRDVGQQQQVQQRGLEEEPLAPPPPLSYLVGQGQRRGGHSSSPSLPNSPGLPPPHGMSISSSTAPMSISQSGMSMSPSGQPGLSISPPSAPSSALPSPTSARLEPMHASHVRKPSGAGMVDSEQFGGYHPAQPQIVEETSAPPPLRSTAPPLTHMTSEPDMRQRNSQHMDLANAPPVPRMPATLSQVGRNGSAGSWRDKSLPPLPGEMGVRGMGEPRPRTLFGMGSVPSDLDNELGLQPPAPGFRAQAGRRQSFSGIGAGEVLHPNMRASTLLAPAQPQTQGKRKSKFLGALLGRGRRESTVVTPEHRSSGSEGSAGRASVAYGNGPMSPMSPSHPGPPQGYASHGYAASQGYAPSQAGYATTNSQAGYAASQAGYAPSVSGYAASQSGYGGSQAGYGSVSGYGGSQAQAHAQAQAHPRRSNIDALVEQAPDFVAYRYPSASEPLR